jgi:maleate isomerase
MAAAGSATGKRLGFLTPSSNTVMEPLLADLLQGTPHTAHFARFRVVAIDLGEASRGQFDMAPVLAAAELLADAKVDSICWGGTSGSWLGFAQDEALCAAITDRTGLPATTATLALRAALRRLGAKRVALVTPYLAEVQRAIIANLAREGFETVAERHLEDPGNWSFASHPPALVDALVEAVAAEARPKERPEAIIIHCTNFRGLPGALGLAARLGIPVLDSVAMSLEGALSVAA